MIRSMLARALTLWAVAMVTTTCMAMIPVEGSLDGNDFDLCRERG
ncbi:MAG: hypothetical protein R3D81_09410 [Thalassovita sp.]